MTEHEALRGSCHCGAVTFSVTLSDGLATARRCNCSFCSMRGAVAVSANLDDLRILTGADVLTSYRFNTHTADHHFCSRCGIYTHHRRRSAENEYGVNVACLESLSPFELGPIPVMDGIRHPRDNGGKTRRAGVLVFHSDPE
jgi:hypothetical protein